MSDKGELLRQRFLEVLACPECGGRLALLADEARLDCVGCGRSFKVARGLPNFLGEEADGEDPETVREHV